MGGIAEDIFELHEQVKAIIKEFQWYSDHDERVTLHKRSKKTVTKYLKASYDLNHTLRSIPNPTTNLKTFFQRYAKEMNQDAKKVVGVFLKYGYGCDKEHSNKFQVELAEAHHLLKHRIDVEEFYLLPEYKLLQKRRVQSDVFVDFESSNPDLEITQPL